ncbi:hypothetical protein AMS68_004782 [Peltaster fructicola]|uniref:tRNA (uracil(54)-C(5))-methyltransferase n=1 Tax=Peltaster fructicola TaxID=286661 RepID=A0A6H0XX78_9PEZI|nr:hypothetical protein AMS68_004782 [Peltaster fructicola]
MAQKRAFNEGRRHFKKSKKQKTDTTVSAGSNEDVLLKDIRSMLQDLNIEKVEDVVIEPNEVELSISKLSSTGDGLAEKDGQIYVVPFTAPGDIVKAKVYKHTPEESYALADFLEVVKPSDHRTVKPECPYFSQCSGCQFQHLPYTFQLAHKRSVVEKAFRNFSGLSDSLLPTVGDTVGSPLQYGYLSWDAVPPIGFMKKGTRRTMDIEDCPIGTQAVRDGMKRERERVNKNIDTYQRGATLLLRESTTRSKDDGNTQDAKTCITDHKATSTEYVDDFRLDNPAGSFFQNNNSILPVVTSYIRDNILGEGQPPKYMIDAYCGSGFFTITLSTMFERSIGIDISSQSIDFASKNAKLNNLPDTAVKFIAGDANALFASVDKKLFPPDETAIVIDPPRKGCDEGFISQLIDFGPSRICYVSCNVHTQARDIGWLVGGLGERSGMYTIESLRGFDFFPQTSHVEGVAVLSRKVQQYDVEPDANVEPVS